MFDTFMHLKVMCLMFALQAPPDGNAKLIIVFKLVSQYHLWPLVQQRDCQTHVVLLDSELGKTNK